MQKIFIVGLFGSGKEKENEEMPISWGRDEQVMVYKCDGMLLCFMK